MDIAWNMKKLYNFSIKESNKYVNASDVNIHSINHGKKGKKKRGRIMNVRVNGRTVYPTNMLHKKRGSSFDVLALVFFVLILGVSMIMIRNVWQNGLYVGENKGGTVWNASSESASIGASTDNAMDVMDFVVPTVLFMGIVIIAVLAYSNPIPAPFLIFGVLFVFLIMYFANVFKHFYIDMVDTSAIFTNIVIKFPITDLILRSLAMYFLFLYAVVIIVQYARRDSVTG